MADIKYDSLVCGNCGYDGGRAHVAKVAELEKELIESRKNSDETQVVKYWAFAVTSIVCCLIAAFTISINTPKPVASDTSIMATETANMYNNCLNSVVRLDDDVQAEALERCNETFEDFLKKQKETVINEEN